MNRRLGASVLATLLLTAMQARALEILSDSERAERERERKLKAKPVLSCKPASLSTKAKRGDTAELLLVIRNAGGRTLRWSLGKLPRWLAADVTTGELKHAEEKRVVLHVRTRLVSGGGVESGITIVAPGADGSPLTVPIAVAVEEPPPPKPTPVRPTEAPPEPVVGAGPYAEPRARRFMARAGVVLPGSASDEERDPGLLIGAAYDLRFLRSDRLVIEVSADVGSVSDHSGTRSSTMVMLSGTARYSLTGGGVYMTGGGSLVLDSYSSDVSDAEGENVGALVGLGIGLRQGAGSLDLRLSHQVLLGSDNVGGLTALTAGYSF